MAIDYVRLTLFLFGSMFDKVFSRSFVLNNVNIPFKADNSKIKKELGFSVSINFEKGIRDTVKWYLDNQDWWMSILGRE